MRLFIKFWVYFKQETLEELKNMRINIKIIKFVVLALLANVVVIGAQMPGHASVVKAASIDPTYSISGVVQDVAGNPMQDITVEVSLVPDDGSDPVLQDTVMTDAAGLYSVDGLAPATYNVHISDQSSTQQQFRTAVDLMGLQIVDASLTDQNATIVETGIISGVVTDSSGVLDNASVELRDEFGTSVTEIPVNNDGTFSFSSVAPGTYSLLVTAPSHQDLYVNDVVVQILSETAYQAGDIQMSIAAGLSGTLVDSGALPVFNAQVELYCVNTTDVRCNGLLPIQTTTSNLDGTYSFDGLAAGSYRLKFLGSQAAPAFSNFWYSSSSKNATNFANAQEIVIQSGQIKTKTNPAPVVGWAKVSGEIDSGPDPLGGATVSLVTLDNQTAQTAQTDETGQYTLFAPIGVYRVEVSAPGFASTYLSIGNDGSGVTTLKPSEAYLVTFDDQGKVSCLNLAPKRSMTLPATDVAEAGGTLSVAVNDSSDDQVTDGVATLYDKLGNKVAWQDTPDENGLFIFNAIPAGTYGVSYESIGHYSKVFYGGTFGFADPATKFVPIADGVATQISIKAIALANLKIYLKASQPAQPSVSPSPYSDQVTIEVYDFDGTSWTINSTLTQQGAIDVSKKYMSIPVSAAGKYRVRILPDDSRVGSIWLGSNRQALSVDDASTITIPTTGSDYSQTAILEIASSVNIYAELLNSYVIGGVKTSIRQLALTVTGDNNGSSIELASKQFTTVGAGEKINSLFSQMPTRYFPLTITATSIDAVYDPQIVTIDQIPEEGDISVTFDNYSEVNLATLSGTLYGLDSKPVVGGTVNLLLNNGDTFDISVTDENGEYSFIGIPLGIHFSVSIGDNSLYIKTSDNDGSFDFVSTSDQVLKIDINQHVASSYSGLADGSDLKVLPGAKINIWQAIDGSADFSSIPNYVVYADAVGAWEFDGFINNADVGSYYFQVDGNDSNSLPAFYSKECQTPALDCSSTLSSDSQSIDTTESAPSVSGIILVVQKPDLVPPSDVKWATKPADVSTGNSITWTWTGSDAVDSTSLESQVVLASRNSSDSLVGAWSPTFAQNAKSYTVSKVVAGSTYCLAIRLVDQSNNASKFISPSCTTIAYDDAKFTPLKKKDWKKSKSKGTYLGTLLTSSKKSKLATLTAKGYVGASVCVLYSQDPGMGSFGILIGTVKKGAPKATAGKHNTTQSVCVGATVKSKDVIKVVVTKPGKGVEIDGFAVLPKAPKAPTS